MPHNLWSELRSTAARWMLKRVQHDEEGGEVAKQPPKRKWGRHCCQPQAHLQCNRMILGDRLSRVCRRWLCRLLADRAAACWACPVARQSRLSSPGHLAGVRSRQAVGLDPISKLT